MGTLPQGTLVGRWTVEEAIARGGQATVYRARHAGRGGPAALKLFHAHAWADPAFQVRVRREVEALVALEHPSVIPVYDAGEHDGRGFLVMRLARAGSLADRLERGPLAPAEAASLVAQIGSALDAAHAAGRLHRDVKPGNVLLDPDGHAWLADFGVARRMAARTPTGGGSIVGTAAYLAPEVVSGGAPTPAADRYALAALAFEAFTGRRPFPDEDVGALLYAQVNRPAPRASHVRPGLPGGLDDVLLGALAKEPRHRPESGAALARSVRHAVAGHAAPPPPPARPRRRRRGRAALGAVTLGTLVMAGSLAALGVVLTRDGSAPRERIVAAAREVPLPPVPTPTGTVAGSPALASDVPGAPVQRAAAADVGPVHVAAVEGRPGRTARQLLGGVRSALEARGLSVRYIMSADGEGVVGLNVASPGDLSGTGPQWALLLVGDGSGSEDRATAVVVRGTGYGPSRYAAEMAAARGGDLLQL